MGILSLQNDLLMSAPHVESASGSVVTFNTDMKAPLKSLVVNITPIQDLHGYDAPYPAGGSNNLIPDGTDTSNGYVSGYYLKNDDTTAASANWYISEYFPVTAEATYTWSGKESPNAPSICFYDENKTYISSIQAEQALPKTFTVPSGAVYCRASQVKVAYFASSGQQIELGSTATTIKPHSNICPITGLTEANISNLGGSSSLTKSFTYTQDGTGTASPDNIRAIHGPALSFVRDDSTTLNLWKGILTINIDGTSKITEPWRYYLFDGETYKCTSVNTASGYYYLNISTPYFSNTTVALNCSHYYGTSYTHRTNNKCIVNSTTSGTTRINDNTRTETTSEEFNNWLKAQVEAGTPVQVVVRQNTTYTLSAAETKRALASLGTGFDNIHISWQTEAGEIIVGELTIYKDGSVDVTRIGVVQKFTGYNESANRIYSPNLDADYYDTGSGGAISTSGGYTKISFRVNSNRSSQYKYNSSGNKAPLCNIAPHYYGGSNSTHWYRSTNLYLWLPSSVVGTTKAEVVTFLRNLQLADTPLETVVEYATPITYHLDSIDQLTTLFGANNIWADTGDISSLKYWKHN